MKMRDLIAVVEAEMDEPGVIAADVVHALLPAVERAKAEAWDDGYRAAQLDADEQPYSDRPERATWQPRSNPHRASEATP